MKEFFVKLGAAAAPPSKPKVLADAAAAVQPLQRPAALPEGGAARVQELFHGSPEGGSKGAAGAPVPKSAAIVSLAQPLLAAAAAGDYAKWHALVSNATAQDKASYRAWSKQLKKLDAGGDKKETKDAVAKHVATGMSWWVETWAQPDRKEGGLQSIAGRAALARKKVAATLAKDFFAPAGSPARAKARGETSAAALAWLEKEADARKQAFAAGGGPAPDCSWFPKAGTVVRPSCTEQEAVPRLQAVPQALLVPPLRTHLFSLALVLIQAYTPCSLVPSPGSHMCASWPTAACLRTSPLPLACPRLSSFLPRARRWASLLSQQPRRSRDRCLRGRDPTGTRNPGYPLHMQAQHAEAASLRGLDAFEMCSRCRN